MISALITLLIVLLGLGVLYWAVTTILGALPIPEPFRTVIHVILVVIMCLVVIWLLVSLIGMIPHGALRLP